MTVQGDTLDHSRTGTVVCVPLTGDLRWNDAPGNVLLPARSTGLPGDSVAGVSQLVAIGPALLTERVGPVSRRRLELLLAGIEIVPGR